VRPRRRALRLSCKRGWITVHLPVLAIAVVLLLPATSHASITVGSDLTLPTASTPENCLLSSPPCTHLPFSVHAGNAFPRKSPTKGLITSFGIKSGAADTVTFRLGRLPEAGGGSGAGTGPMVTLPGAGTYAYPAAVPVKLDDIIGIDSSSTRALSALPTCAQPGPIAAPGYVNFHPPLTHGMVQSGDSTVACELLVNAVITPSNKFHFGKLKIIAFAGAAILTVRVPGPGELFLAGKDVAKQAAASRGARVSKAVKAAGAAKLRIKPTGEAKRKLVATGKVTVKVHVTFTPTGGSPNAETRKITLRRRV